MIFIAGLVVGGLLGIGIMALIMVNADDDTRLPGYFGADDDTGAIVKGVSDDVR